VPAGTTLRYDKVPLEDFLACLGQHEQDVRVGFLPPQSSLKEVLLEARAKVSGEEALPLAFYLLQETDALSQRTEIFVLIHGPSARASALRELAVRFRRFLEVRKIPSLFRLDPRYGLVYGSAAEPVDETLKWDRPGSYVALYLTTDPASPGLAVGEYVALEYRRRFHELFLKYNRVPPATPGLLAATWKKILMKDRREEAAPRRITYRLLKAFCAFVAEEAMEGAVISFICKDLSQEDGRKILLDSKYGTFLPAGQDRFFASLGELA
jgi:hypothetical protein